MPATTNPAKVKRISDNSLRRRVKKDIIKRRHQFFAVCTPGFEDVLQTEISGLPGVTEVCAVRGGVIFNGPIDCVYAANMYLNTAHRLLLRIREFSAKTFPMLFDQLGRVAWELWLPDNASYAIRVRAKASKLNMIGRITETCRGAIDTRLTALGLTAHLTQGAAIVFTLRLFRDHATLSLDTSGDHLHKRGYKPFSVTAPMRETLACAILLKSRYYEYDLVVDPFCGSGTILIEGARMAMGRPAGFARAFGFNDTYFFRPSKLSTLRSSVYGPVEHPIKFVGFDNSAHAIHASTRNIEEARVQDLVTVRQMNFLNNDFNGLGPQKRRLLITNPPYGKRVVLSDTDETTMVNSLIQSLDDWSLAIVSATDLTTRKTLDKQTRSRLARGTVLPFVNGGLPAYLHLLHT